MPEPETTPPACETGDVRTCTIACPEHGNPDACGAACSEQHTYRLNECALACKEIGGGVADRSWTVPCSLCGTKIGFPCYDSKGRASGISHGKRWDAYDRAEVAARRAAKASPAVPVPGLRDLVAGAVREWHGDWNKATFAEAADAILAVVQPHLDRLAADQERYEEETVGRFNQQATNDRRRAETAEAALTRVQEIDPDKLDLLADWLDTDDARKGPGRDFAVQADLRQWARTLRALTPPVPADQPEGGVG